MLLIPGFLLIFPFSPLIFCFNIFITQIPSPILLSLSKLTFTSSQLNSWCDNSSCISFAPCASLCNFSSKFHRIHPHPLSPMIGFLNPPNSPSTPLILVSHIIYIWYNSAFILHDILDWWEYIIRVGYDPLDWWSDAVNWIKYPKVIWCNFLWSCNAKPFRI